MCIFITFQKYLPDYSYEFIYALLESFHAFLSGKVVGVAFESMTNADNIGYIIPVPIIQHFLQKCYGDKANYQMGFGW